MLITGVYSGNHVSDVKSNRYAKRNSVTQNKSSFDTVTISDEARAAYKKLQSSAHDTQNNQVTNKFSKLGDTKLEAILTNWFNNAFSTGNTVISGDVIMNVDGGSLLPENEALKKHIESQIDKICEDENYAPPAVASPEFLAKLQPLRQKLNVISALGDKLVITDTLLEEGTSFLQKLEDQWSARKGIDASLESQFRAALKGNGDTENNRMSEEERIRKMKEEAMEKLNKEN